MVMPAKKLLAEASPEDIAKELVRRGERDRSFLSVFLAIDNDGLRQHMSGPSMLILGALKHLTMAADERYLRETIDPMVDEAMHANPEG